MKQQEEGEKKKKDRKVKVVSFRLSERDYERHLSMAKICHENDLTKGPDIVSYIRLSMECLVGIDTHYSLATWRLLLES
jgi:hypothetical protein